MVNNGTYCLSITALCSFHINFDLVVDNFSTVHLGVQLELETLLGERLGEGFAVE